MTCTHAAITRRKLIDLNFKYDTLIIEEAGQILEVETLIPMLLQRTDSDAITQRLKRVILIGDHMQLPPVIQHNSLQKYSKLDQSLFLRFIRLGIPYIQLDKQGRSRAEIANLYNWRYNGKLGNLSYILNDHLYQTSNAGFVNTFQFINVNDFNGKGEITPTPYYYQNLGEAEYVVAVYQYMRLIGYPAEKITILTTYTGQKTLILDILSQRCKNPIFGLPNDVSTVDKYQGQQNDYILLSLVRTSSIGHIRDIRRLVVALSRARLGLYVFGKQQLYENCFELSTAFNVLLSKPSALQLVVGESYRTNRHCNEVISNKNIFTVTDVTQMGVLVYQMVQQGQQQQQAQIQS